MANHYEFLKSKYPDEARYKSGVPTFTALEVLTLLKEREASISFQPPVMGSVCDCVVPDYSNESGEWCRRCNTKIL